MNSTPRILCLMPNVRPGGAARVMCALTAHWAQSGHRVLLAVTKPNLRDFYEVHPAVARAVVARSRLLGTAALGHAAQALSLRKLLRSWTPDVIVSFLPRTNVQALLSSVGLGIPVVVSEHDDPRGRGSTRWTDVFRWTLLRRAACIVAQNDEIADWMMKRMPGARVLTIANPIRPPAIDSEYDPTSKNIVAMGRLSFEKGFDLLLTAFAAVSTRHREWSLTILGNGPEHERLSRMIRELGLKGMVRLQGLVKDPERHLAAAGMFVCSSRSESFGLALAEAMACGLPVVAFDCPSGPRQLIRDGYDGMLVPADDVTALTTAMQRLMDDPTLRRQLGQRASDVVNRFSAKRILGQWDALVSELISARRPA